MTDLNRFIKAQKKYFGSAKLELLNKKKKTHWIWYIFPQLKGLGKSYYSDYYGLKNFEEAEEYYKNNYLRSNLNELTDIILSYGKIDLEEVFGSIDAKKVCSCMTLFYFVTGEERFKQVIFRYYYGILDENTVNLFKKSGII